MTTSKYIFQRSQSTMTLSCYVHVLKAKSYPTPIPQINYDITNLYPSVCLPRTITLKQPRQCCLFSLLRNFYQISLRWGAKRSTKKQFGLECGDDEKGQKISSFDIETPLSLCSNAKKERKNNFRVAKVQRVELPTKILS